MMNSTTLAATREPGLLKPAVLWLLLLAPVFFGTYGFATWVTAQRADVGAVVFGWEAHMPFWPWTIVPYWSIDLLYGLSLLLPRSREALKRHALRLLSAQVIAVSCFLLWPLRFTFERPEIDGLFGWLFAVLAGFDKPFNQAPSLHIALLVILWVCYAQHSRGPWRWLVHGWFSVIGISVLTTYQHHFIDVPTGALAGWLCVWLWPLEGPAMLQQLRPARDRKRWRLACCYALGATLFTLAAFTLKGGWLWLIWPAVALLLVALNYALFDAAGFQKGADGRLSSAALWLLAPYLLSAWINSRLWTRQRPQPDEVVDNVWLGRIPGATELAHAHFTAVLDLCAELPLHTCRIAYRSVPVLDLIAPTTRQCLALAQALENLRHQGPLLVCCALGYSRSATAVAAWLLYSGRAKSVDAAVAIIRRARPGIVLHAAHRLALEPLAGNPGTAHEH
ncbi:phosphatase PAP2/dual specificity phosphatase family protein [Pseudomonas sp. BJa5]|uniref:phosphatase PAP2/dual specificity phosphatase family protein n=1 Tax=Pseudomonas sp. BJa5 TaxID=2936270 RepID=UPI00255A2613|nr:phosphatase PAP2/dual specificity phosphatase family protein [Pseudomonas sp. BGr12]MDL2421144.1 phosphatase PAP2/dual specificity phosphatase family protein [Pseudomonas sp. BGr12]